jgi:hypothetical protein
VRRCTSSTPGWRYTCTGREHRGVSFLAAEVAGRAAVGPCRPAASWQAACPAACCSAWDVGNCPCAGEGVTRCRYSLALCRGLPGPRQEGQHHENSHMTARLGCHGGVNAAAHTRTHQGRQTAAGWGWCRRRACGPNEVGDAGRPPRCIPGRWCPAAGSLSYWRLSRYKCRAGCTREAARTLRGLFSPAEAPKQGCWGSRPVMVR